MRGRCGLLPACSARRRLAQTQQRLLEPLLISQFLRSIDGTHLEPTDTNHIDTPTNKTGMAAPRLRVVLRDYIPPSAACQVLPAEPLPLDDDGGDGAAAVVRAIYFVI